MVVVATMEQNIKALLKDFEGKKKVLLIVPLGPFTCLYQLCVCVCGWMDMLASRVIYWSQDNNMVMTTTIKKIATQILQTNQLLETERKLFVYFFTTPGKLRQTVSKPCKGIDT